MLKLRLKNVVEKDKLSYRIVAMPMPQKGMEDPLKN